MKDNTGKSLTRFKKGVLCYAVLAPHKGKGKPKVILHEAEIDRDGLFSYGHKKCYVLSPKAK